MPGASSFEDARNFVRPTSKDASGVEGGGGGPERVAAQLFFPPYVTPLRALFAVAFSARRASRIALPR